MNLSNALALLRRRIKEETAENWTDAELIVLLNKGVVDTQKAVIKHDAKAFVSISSMDLESGREFYEKPPGYWYALHVQYRSTPTGRFVDMEKKPYDLGRERQADGLTPQDSASVPVYSHMGRHIAVNPVPELTVVNGLRYIYVPSMRYVLPTDVVDLHPGLEFLPIFYAERLALGETEENAETVAKVNAMIDFEVSQIPNYYKQSADGWDTIYPQVEKY